MVNRPNSSNPSNLRSEDPDIFNQIIAKCQEISIANKYYDEDKKDTIEYQIAKLALIITEVVEAIEAIRRKSGNSDKIKNFSQLEEEIADVLIRTLDFAKAYDLAIIPAILEKLDYNAKRADHKPEAKEDPEGKQI